ncbi:uncharacterized protein PSFLO_07520 [Pseudozyma flocculosa]|nr:uncharacterized protein PSFLO_07520 [Pseudozyma flocculosa]
MATSPVLRALPMTTARRSVSNRAGASSTNIASKPAPRRPNEGSVPIRRTAEVTKGMDKKRPSPAAAYRAPEPAGGSERSKRINSKSVWSSWKDLSPRTKLVFAAGLATFAMGGLLVADKLEELFPARNNRSPSRRSQISTVAATEGSEPKMMEVPANDDGAGTSAQRCTAEAHSPPPQPRLFAISVVDREPTK